MKKFFTYYAAFFLALLVGVSILNKLFLGSWMPSIYGWILIVLFPLFGGYWMAFADDLFSEDEAPQH
ncbi:hypothetical protein [Oceanithermus sp.]|uniref:hypothetical protein n=1 Tax=Oceanithermus sp. TaxID=2268145 RepID=UPI0025FC70E4|nr:hypothetical protein [Oceanithermus sp.]